MRPLESEFLTLNGRYRPFRLRLRRILWKGRLGETVPPAGGGRARLAQRAGVGRSS